MNNILHRYPDEKPREPGMYGVVEKFSCVSTLKYEYNKYVGRNVFLSPDVDEHILYWFFLDDFLPEDAKDGFYYRQRGVKYLHKGE